MVMVLMLMMAAFAWGATYIAAQYGVAYVVGIATAIIVTEIHSLKGTFRIETETGGKDADK